MRESDQNKTTRAVFILNTRLRVGMGAARIRCYDAARIVGDAAFASSLLTLRTQHTVSVTGSGLEYKEVAYCKLNFCVLCQCSS